MADKLTPKEIGLLGDVGDPEVRVYGRYQPSTLTTAYRLQRSPYAPIETVTRTMAKLRQLGYVDSGSKDGPSVSARFEVVLTDAGRAYLESLVES